MNIERRVAQLIEPCLEALNAGDLDAFAAFWTRDAILYSALGPELEGSDAIRAWAAAIGTKNAVLQPTRCETFVDVIFVVGNFAYELPRRGLSIRGGFTALLREVGGRTPKMHRLVAFPERVPVTPLPESDIW